MKLKGLLKSLWFAVRRRFLVWCLCSVLAALGIGVALDFQRLARSCLMQEFEGGGYLSRLRVRMLLKLCGFRDYPEAIDLFSPGAQYSGQWFHASFWRRVYSCSVVADVRSGVLYGPGNRITYRILLDGDGGLLLSGYDGGFAASQMEDLNADSVCEKILFAHAYPEGMPSAEEDTLRDQKLEVYRLDEGRATCVFRARYAAFWSQSPVGQPSGFVRPRVTRENEWSYPPLALELPERKQNRVLTQFLWDPATSELSGPQGGPDQRWKVEFSHSLPAVWRVETAPPIQLPRFLVYAFPIAAVLIGVDWVLRGRRADAGRGLGVRARVLVVGAIFGAMILLVAVATALWLRRTAVLEKAYAFNSTIMPRGRADLVEDMAVTLDNWKAVAEVRAACHDADLAATWNTMTVTLSPIVRPDGEVQVRFCAPAWCVREFSWRDLQVRYVATGDSPLARDVMQRNDHAVESVVETIRNMESLTRPAEGPRPLPEGVEVYTEWPFDTAEAKRRQQETAAALGLPIEEVVDLGGGQTLTLVLVPAGEFRMGCVLTPEEIDRRWPDAQGKWQKGQLTLRRVRVDRPIYVGRTEVTRGQFAEFVRQTGFTTEAEHLGWASTIRKVDGNWTMPLRKGVDWRHPGFAQTDANPAVCVTRSDAVIFCKWLSWKGRRTYTLPAGVQWEYACRAGSDGVWPWGSREEDTQGQANVACVGEDLDWSYAYKPSVRDGHTYTAPVASFAPNAFGLYDTIGNVFERYAEWEPAQPEDEAMRLEELPVWRVRGGGWCSGPLDSRASYRSDPLNYPQTSIGFRVCRDAWLPAVTEAALPSSVER